MKILFYLPYLECGGAETVTVRIANHFAESGFDVNLVTAIKGGGLERKLSLKIKYECLACKNQWLSIIPLATRIREIKPDIVFSTMKESNFILICAKFISRTYPKLVIREANTISQQLMSESKFHQKIKNKLISYSYRYADRIVCLSEAMKSDLVNEWRLCKSKIDVINNPIDFSSIEKFRMEHTRVRTDNAVPNIVIVARLFKQKNHSFLLSAMSEYKNKYGSFNLYIVGDGPLRFDLESQSNALNLSKNVKFIGHTDNPYEYLYLSELFVLPSHFEGFSNALLEASACGLKVLVSDSQSTSVEFIERYNLGDSYIQNDTEDFCRKLKSLLDTTRCIGANPSPDLTEFSFNNVFKKYEETILGS